MYLKGFSVIFYLPPLPSKRTPTTTTPGNFQISGILTFTHSSGAPDIPESRVQSRILSFL